MAELPLREMPRFPALDVMFAAGHRIGAHGEFYDSFADPESRGYARSELAEPPGRSRQGTDD